MKPLQLMSWYWRLARTLPRVDVARIHSRFLTHFPPPSSRHSGAKRLHHEAPTTLTATPQAQGLWLPPDVHPDEDALTSPRLQRTVPERKLKDVFAAFEQMARYHPSEPHWYLPLIGVADPLPPRQRIWRGVNATCAHPVRPRPHPGLSRIDKPKEYFPL